MKMKRICKKIIARVLIAVMLISVFSTVDMGWNVMEVKAGYVTSGKLVTVESYMGTYYAERGTWNLTDGTLTINLTGSPGGLTLNFCKDQENMDAKLNKEEVRRIIINADTYLTFNMANTLDGFSNVTELEFSKSTNGVSRVLTSITNSYFNPLPALQTLKLDGKFSLGSSYTAFNGLGTSEKPVTIILGDSFEYDYDSRFDRGPDLTKPENRIGTVNWLEGWFKFPHTHNWSVTATSNKITLKCIGDGDCTETNGKVGSTLTVTAENVNYTGNTYNRASASLSGNAHLWSPAGKTYSTAITYYSGTTKLSSAPKNAGTYIAKVTAGGQTAEKTFKINKINPVKSDFTYTDPTNLVYNKNQKTATVTAKSDKTTGKITIEYYNSSGHKLTTAPVEAGTYKVKISVEADTNYNAATFEMGEFTITRADYSGDKTASGTLKLVTGKTTEITLPTLPDGATYGSITNSNTSYFTVGEVTDGKVLVTAVKNGYEDTDYGNKTFTVAVDAAATVYKDYEVTVTITPEFHKHYFTFSVPDSAKNTIEAKCDNSDGDCFLQDYKVAITLSADDKVYTGSSYNGASVDSTEWVSARLVVPTIEYAKKDTTEFSSTAPVNAGEYTAKITVADDGHDDIAETDFTIEKATQNATAKVDGYNWGDSTDLPTPSCDNLKEAEQALPEYFYNEANSTEGGKSWSNITDKSYLDAGTYYIYVTLNETDNYKGGTTTASAFKIQGLTIAPDIIKVTSHGGTDGVEYDQKPHTADIKVEGQVDGEDVNPDDYTITYSTTPEGPFVSEKPTFTDVGEHKIYYRVKRFGYEVASGNVDVKINPIKITISGVKAKDKVYDGDTRVTFDYSEVNYDGLLDGDTLTISAKGTFADKNVGEGKTVTVSTTDYELGGASAKNYVLAESGQQDSASANITQREVTLNWGTTTFTYDGQEKRPTATAGNLVDADSCNVTIGLEGASDSRDAGTYTAIATSLSNGNYKLPTNVIKKFIINKAEQSGTLTMTGYTYNETVSEPSVSDYKATPVIKYYYSLKNVTTGGTLWDNVEPTTLEPDDYYMYAVLEETTNYKSYTTNVVPFKVTGIDFADADVTAEGKTTDYTGIEEHGITVTAIDGATVKYGTSEGDYTFSSSPTYKNVGTYTVYYKVTKTGYNPKKGSAVITINKATLHVTPDAGQTKVYGDADPVFTYTVSGLLGSDTASVVSGTLTRDAGENVTVAGYELSKNNLTASNYNITCTSGVKFMITPRDITADMVTLTKKKFERTGESIDVSAGGNIVAKYNGEDITYSITSGQSATALGTYNVTIEGTGNFKGTVSKEWKITNAIVPNVSAISFEVPYDGNSHTITISGTEDEDIITYGISEDAIDQESVSFIYAGTHTVWYKVARGEYEPFEASATVTINPKEISVTWGSTSLVYNGMTQTPQATASGLIGSDVCEVIVAGLGAKNVGSYTATATGVSNVNYKLPDSKPTTGFEIIPKPITVTGKNASKYVNKADPVLTYVAQSVCVGDVLSGVIVTRDAGESVGSYPIRVTVNDSLNPNYAITTQNGTFTIKNPEPKEEPRDDGNSGNNTTPVVNAPIVKPNIQLPEALVPVVNKAETTTNTKAKEVESEPVNDEGVDLNAGKLTLHVEVLEESPIKKAEVSNQVGELLDNSDIFTLEEVAAIKNGENARVWVSVDKMDMSKISSDEQKQLTEVAKSIEGDDVKLLYFDINMFKQIGSSEIFAIREPGTLIKVSIELPEYAINLDEHMEREYKVLRLHDGEITVLDTEYDPATRMLTFATDKFSTYVFAYVDKPVDEENAENAAGTDEISVSNVADDASSLNVWLFIIPVIIIAGIICAIIIYRKKREDDMTV